MPAHHGGVRVLGVQGEQGAAGSVAQVGGVADEEVEQVADLQGEQIRGPPHEQLVQDAGRTDPVAPHPRGDRVVVGLLPLVHRDGRHPLERAGRHRDVGLVGGREVEVREQGAGHRDVGVLLGEGGRQVDDLRVVPEQPVDGPVVERHRLGGAAHRVAVLVVLGLEQGGAGHRFFLQVGRRAHRPLTPLA